jgi:EmrB/QacA subfamily drug resistance transporter
MRNKAAMDSGTAQRVALLVAVLSSFINPFMGASINVALKALGQDLALDAVLLGWTQTAFLVASAAVLVPVGRLSDIHGRRRVFMLGTAVFTGASLVAGLAGGPALFLAARAVQGIGGAMMVANAVSILVSVFPPERRGRVIGIAVASVYAGLSLGPMLGGLLVSHVSWRGIFLTMVPLGVLVLWLTGARLRGDWADAAGERFDWRGAAVYTLSVPAVMAGASFLPRPLGFALLMAGAVGLALFVGLALRAGSPLYPVRELGTNRMFGLSNLVALLAYVSSYSIPFLISLYLQHIHDLSASEAGLVMIVQPALMALVTPLSGRLSDRLEPRLIVSIGLGLHAAGLFALSRLGQGSSLVTVGGLLALVGVGLGLFSSPNMSAIVGSVQRRSYGVATASAGTMRLLGQSLGMATTTLLAALLIGRVQLGPAHHGALLHTLQVGFTAFSGVALAGVGVSLLRGRMHRE